MPKSKSVERNSKPVAVDPENLLLFTRAAAVVGTAANANAVGRATLSTMAVAADVAKKVSFVVGTSAAAVFALDSYVHISGTPSTLHKLNPCNYSYNLPTVANYELAFPKYGSMYYDNETQLIEEMCKDVSWVGAQRIFNAQICLLPLVVSGTALACYTFSKIESGLNFLNNKLFP